MEKTKEQIISIMEEDINVFQQKVDYYKHNKRKLIIPKCSNELIASASIVAYLTQRLHDFKGVTE